MIRSLLQLATLLSLTGAGTALAQAGPVEPAATGVACGTRAAATRDRASASHSAAAARAASRTSACCA